jgi:hypothetical protein
MQTWNEHAENHDRLRRHLSGTPQVQPPPESLLKSGFNELLLLALWLRSI